MRRLASAALAALLLSLVCAGVGGAESDAAAAAAASGPEEVLALATRSKSRGPRPTSTACWASTTPSGVARALARAWSRRGARHMCPATWDHPPESKAGSFSPWTRRLGQLPRSEGREDRPYVLPLQIPPPPPLQPASPPLPPSPPQLPPIPPIPPLHPLVAGARSASPDAAADPRGVAAALFDRRPVLPRLRPRRAERHRFRGRGPAPHETHTHADHRRAGERDAGSAAGRRRRLGLSSPRSIAPSRG